MRKFSNILTLQNAIILLTFVVIAKFICVILLMFLPKSGINISDANSQEITYRSYKVAKIFGLKKVVGNSIDIKPKEVLKIDSLILRGLYGNSEVGFIVFAEKSNPKINQILALNKTYKGYKLIQIRQKSAILRKGSKSYELEFKLNQSTNFITRVKQVVQEKPNIQTDVVRAVSRKDVMHYAKNFDEIWKNIAIQEIEKDGKIQGFAVLSVNQKSIFAKLGLTQGDIIKAVNNQEIKSYADAFNIYNNIKNYETLKIEIIRNKQKKELEYEIF